MIFAGIDFSLIALIGIILLIGIVKKNAIMMIDFALDAERNEGLPPEKSIYQACLLRFRPIMMTTMAALLGALPLALENGTGSELRRPLGIAIVGGFCSRNSSRSTPRRSFIYIWTGSAAGSRNGAIAGVSGRTQASRSARNSHMDRSRLWPVQMAKTVTAVSSNEREQNRSGRGVEFRS